MTTTMKLMLSIFVCSIALALTFMFLGVATYDDKWEDIMNKASITFGGIWICSIIGIILTWIWDW